MVVNADTMHSVRQAVAGMMNERTKGVPQHLQNGQQTGDVQNTNRTQNSNGNRNIMSSSTSRFAPGARINLDTPVDHTMSFAFRNDMEVKDIKVTLANGAIYEATEKTTFESLGLSEDIINAAYVMNYKRPSRIQEVTIPLLLQDPPVNLIAQAQTGTGKTAAFVFNILMRVDPNMNALQALVLTPTRELAKQIHEYISKLAGMQNSAGPTISCGIAVPRTDGRNELSRKHVIVGTPGTVLNSFQHRVISGGEIKVFVLDEGDHMLDQQGLKEQSLRVKRFIPESAQISMFSATFEDNVRKFAVTIAPNANTIALADKDIPLENVRQVFMDVEDENDKYQKIVDMYKLLTVGSSIIFCAKRDTADELQHRLEAEGHYTVSLHSRLESPEARDEVIKKFIEGKAKVMITTNVLARGFDCETINMVIHYDTPRNPETGRPDYEAYIHRVGRCGRFGRTGLSVAFVHDKRSWEELDDISQHFQVPIHVCPSQDIDGLENMLNAIMKYNQSKFGASNTMTDSKHAPQSRRWR